MLIYSRSKALWRIGVSIILLLTLLIFGVESAKAEEMNSLSSSVDSLVRTFSLLINNNYHTLS